MFHKNSKISSKIPSKTNHKIPSLAFLQISVEF